MTRFASREAFRAHCRKRYAEDFALHSRVAGDLQPFLLEQRSVDSPLRIALDFHFVQAYKAHDSVAILAGDGLAEDAATITRRLLELAIQAVYIGADSDHDVRQERAGRFLAFLWREANEAAKDLLPGEAKSMWDSILARYGKSIPERAPRWGPTFRQMFEYAEQTETYKEDYSLLSRIAHGAPEEFLVNHSQERFPLRSTLHTPGVLRFSSRYYVGLFEIWNREFKSAPDTTVGGLTAALADNEEETGGPPDLMI